MNKERKKIIKVRRELILINITGSDRAGLTAELMEILARYNADVLDIVQADIHHNLSLGILIKTDTNKSGDILKELLFKTNALKVQVSFNIVTEEEYNEWVGRQGKNRYIITILGRKITAQQIAATAKVIAGQDLNIDSITRLTGRIPLDDNQQSVNKACIEFSVRGTPKISLKCRPTLWDCRASSIMTFHFKKTPSIEGAGVSFALIWILL